jgi:hypothetical protein
MTIVLRTVIPLVLSVTGIHIFPSQVSRAQLIIQGKTGYMFRLKQAIIRPVTRTLKNAVLIDMVTKTNKRTQVYESVL